MKISAVLILAGLVYVYGEGNATNTTANTTDVEDDGEEVLLENGRRDDNYVDRRGEGYGDYRRGEGYGDYRRGDGYGEYSKDNYGYGYRPRSPPVYHYPSPEYPDFIEPTDPGKEVPYPFVDIPKEVEGHEEILPPISGYNCFLTEAPYSTCGRRSIQAYFLEQCVGLYYLLSENVNGICGGHRKHSEPEPEQFGYGPYSEHRDYYQGFGDRDYYGDHSVDHYGDRDEYGSRRRYNYGDYGRVLVEDASADYSPPTYEQPKYGAPKYDEPKYGPSKYGEPQYGAPKYNTPQYGPSNYGDSKYKPAAYDEPKYGSKYEAPKYGSPKYDAPKYGSKYETPKYEQPKYGAPKYDQPKYGPPKYDQPKYSPGYDPKYASSKPTPAPTGYGDQYDAVAEYQKEKCLQKSYVSITTAVVMCLTENFIRVKFIEHYACYAKQNPIEGPILYLKKLHTFIRNVIKCSDGKKAIENYPNLWITFRNEDGKVAYNPNAPYFVEKTDNRISLPFCSNGEAAGLSRFTVGGPGKYFLCSNTEYIKDTNPLRGYYSKDVSNVHYDIPVIESCNAASKLFLGLDTNGHSRVLKSCQHYGKDHDMENDDIHTPNRQALSDQSLESLYNSVSFVQKSTSVLTRPLTIAEIATRISGPVAQPLLEGFGILYYCAFHACKANTHNDVDGNCFPKFEDCDTEWHVPSGVTSWDAIKDASRHIKHCLAHGRLTNKGIAENAQVVEYNAALRRSYICLAEPEIVDFLQHTWNVKSETLRSDAIGLVYLRHIAVEKCHEDVKACKSNVDLYSLLIKALNSLETDCKNYRPAHRRRHPEPKSIEFPKPIVEDDDADSEPKPERRPRSEDYVPQPEQRPQYENPRYGDYRERREYGDRQYGVPNYEAPKYGQPEYQAPKYGQPQYEAPKYGSPQYEAPKYGAPQYEAPKYEVPKYEAPKPEGYYPRELADSPSNSSTASKAGDVPEDEENDVEDASQGSS